VTVKFKPISSRASRAAAVLLVMLSTSPALAQGSPSSACVTALSQDYGGTAAIRTECTSAIDCTFQAPIGNASAMALIGAMAKKVEACFVAAGLTMVKEDVEPQAATRRYGNPGSPDVCAVLVHTAIGDLADGLHAACRPEIAR
jgi:hypothetical protein